MAIQLFPVHETLAENSAFSGNPLVDESLEMTIEFYKRVGFAPPWIGYYVQQEGEFVGACAFKGKPIDGSVEIAYGTFEPYQNRGVGTAMCKALVNLAQETDPSVRITARTLPENSFSTRVLQKNGFRLSGMVNDPEDGEVWEWVYEEKL